MVEREMLLEIVEQARRRLAARRAWWWGGRVALAAAGAALLLVLVRTIVPFDLPYGLIAVAGLAAGVLTTIVARYTAPVSPLLAAQVLDLRFDCRDRLATAVEILTGVHRPSALGAAVVEDAARQAMALDVRSRLPGRPDRATAIAAATAVAVMLLGRGLTGISLPGTPARQVAQTIQREGRRLERAGQTMEERARADRARITRRVAPSVRTLGEAMQRERLDRSQALARIAELGRQIEEERRRVQQVRKIPPGAAPQQPSPDLPRDLMQQRAAVDKTIRQIREITDRLAQSRSPEERNALMRQLAALAGGGEEGNVPARAREQAAEANRQLGTGDTAGARRTLQQSATDLEDLRAMLADDEGLQQAQRDLRRSADQIASGRPVPSSESEQTPQASVQRGTAAPGNRPLSEGQGPDAAEPPPGPNQGTLPGQGAVQEKLGARTQRLEGEKQQSRIQGMQGEGRVTTSELLGPGRSAQVRVPAGPAIVAARAEADRYMSRMRIPPEYREIVRRYFEALAATR
jgi:hypothetical protein